MIEINEQQIRLQTDPATKQAAIELVGNLLVTSGNITTQYVTSMQQREEVANTFLGNGIAIPHGLNENRDQIARTGIAVLQVPAGVEWNPGETARLIVGIAAKSDEHIEVLRRLTRVLGDEQQVTLLSNTTNPHDIIEALTGERPAETPLLQTSSDYEQFFDAVIQNKTGLHARPAAMFVNIAKRYKADIQIRNGQRMGNGKRLLSLLQLGIEHGTRVRVSAQGVDATDALKALQEAIKQGLGDEEEPARPTSIQKNTAPIWTPQTVEQTISGVAAAPGIAIGPIQHYKRQTIHVADQTGDPIAEGEQFQSALDASQHDLHELHKNVGARSGAGQAAIFEAHGEFLNDAGLIQDTIALIYEGHSAAWSWQSAIEERVDQLKQLKDPVLAGRAADLNDVGQRVLQHLTGKHPTITPANNTDTPAILIADDLAPSDTALLDPRNVLGFCTAGGGPTSHTAIIARSLGIPAIVGAGQEILSISQGQSSILDGSTGKLYLQPGAADIQQARILQEQALQQQEIERKLRFAPATTTDQQRIEVVANIGNVADAQKAAEAGAEGVGLLRTEFLFLGRDSAPDEDEQFEVYRDIIQAMQQQPIIIRTLDIGGDKEVAYLNLPKEANPFLGIRGVRLCFEHPELFIPQLRAIYRAAAYGPVSIMFPMIATLEDWEKASVIAEQVRQELDAPVVPMGIMVEVPSAVMLAEHLAKQVAFFSIGTNDLTQYTLAMDRGHPQLARQADSVHPAVLAMIARTVEAANKEGKWVGVCGGLASDTLGASILAGMGVKELSVSIPSVATIKAHIRASSLTDMQEIARKALQCRNAAEVRAL
ncbi:phosphoenolpyruvate--protein phosphotransferase [Dictyobacter arantiisoli]|uniref:Phosphocarrier protein HPr n=1 Tax=Dictyobacter arantiisoli TaxID=2014874 RepID=A0A5A5TIU5_9CHLR|nr:phosphoenolpyruvate--protein phosphotransferase [Dictyobacter arantiisoli]GCF11337.1 phosphoenolpyruvate--protein phosphotransferase [Dictyobacter arantiisoli]